jgi:beta-galactosidase
MIILLAVSWWVAGNVLAQNRSEEVLQRGWKFTKGNPKNAAATSFNDAEWENVLIPHDWAISGPFIKDGDGNTGKLPWKGEGWYRRNLEIASASADKKIYLLFDGVMAFPEVYVNGQLAGKWDYGYNSFFVDITKFIKPGEPNQLAVYANTEKHDSRWYPGAGLYRKVRLIKTNPVHVPVWGTYITTPIIQPHYAEVQVRTTVQNDTNSEAFVKVVQEIVHPKGMIVATGERRDTLRAASSKDLEVSVQVTNPERWDVNNPALYTVRTKVYLNDQLVDTTSEQFGIREIHFTADDGFHLNGRRVQLKGVNLHHGHGPLGAAFNYRAMQRQLEIMKEMGVNAIRNSHNTAAPELLQLCDEMGLLFFNEVFDKYDGKADITDTTDFDAFAHRNIRNFVMRDRNHPSVFLWSVGNEIGDVQWNIDNGHLRLHTMINYVNKYDPTRPTTLVNDNMQSAVKRHFDYYDVHSWNYGRRYRLARKLEPNKSVVISESASTLSTRGFYEWPLPEDKTNFTKSLQVSSYDLNAPEWAEIADDDFMWQQQESYVAGEFVWTGFDYLGEPTPYNNKVVKEMGMSDLQASRSSYFGIVDLVGIPKDRYYLYKSYWKPEENTVHILPHWTWKGKEGDTVPVFVYTNGDCAELFINGKSQGKRCKDPLSENSVDRFRLMWKETVYAPGEVKAVAYKNGQKIGEQIIKTAGEASEIRLSADRTMLQASGEDLSYILVEAYDKNGIAQPLANQTVNVSVKGPATIAGVGNGNPQSFAPFQATQVELFYGKAMIILKSGFEAGKVTVTVSADDLKTDKVQLEIK